VPPNPPAGSTITMSPGVLAAPLSRHWIAASSPPKPAPKTTILLVPPFLTGRWTSVPLSTHGSCSTSSLLCCRSENCARPLEVCWRFWRSCSYFFLTSGAAALASTFTVDASIVRSLLAGVETELTDVGEEESHPAGPPGSWFKTSYCILYCLISLAIREVATVSRQVGRVSKHLELPPHRSS
jgi:hypothetical protein